MCGFTVIINKNNKNLTNILKNKILNSQNHRGPDYSKIIERDNITFFHNRLSILDLSQKANQPMICKKNRKYNRFQW
jgi:asparagine synthase (glutamine-hydrolysing)